MKKLIIFITFFSCTICLLSAQNWGNIIEQGNRLLEDEKYDEALIFLQKQQKDFENVKPKEYGIFLILMGQTYTQLKNYSEAKNSYLEALTILEQDFGIEYPPYALYLSDLGDIYCNLEDYENAEKVYLEAIEIHENISKMDLFDYSLLLNNLGFLYDKTGNFDKAEKFYQNALTILETDLDAHFHYYLSFLNDFGLFYSKIGNFEKSENLLLNVQNIRKQTQGVNHPDYLNTLYNLTLLYFKMEEYAKAEQFFTETNYISGQNLFVEHPIYPYFLTELGLEYSEKGEYDKAEPLLLEAMSYFGNDHEDFAGSIYNVGLLYLKSGNYSKAIKFLSEILTITVNEKQKENINYVKTLNELAASYYKLGYWDKAEHFLQEAMTICEKISPHDPIYATISNSLGNLFTAIFDFKQAELYFLKAIEVCENSVGKETQVYATYLNNLASIYEKSTDFEKSENLYLEAKTIRENLLGKEHPEYANSLNNLGLLYVNTNSYSKAETCFIETLKIREKVLSRHHPDYAATLNNLGILYYKTGNFSNAEKSYVEAKNIIENVLGKEHPQYVRTLNNLGVLYLKTNNFIKAQQIKIEADRLLIDFIGKNFTFLSDKQRVSFWETNSKDFEICYSYLSEQPGNPIREHVFDNALFTKGLLLRTSNSIRDAIYLSKDQNLVFQYEYLMKIRQTISLMHTQETPDINTLQTLEKNADNIDKELTIASITYKNLKDDFEIKWYNIKDLLQKDEAAIEFVHFRLYGDNQWTENTFYGALIVKKNSSAPIWIPLGDEIQLQQLTKRETNITDINFTQQLYSEKGENLYNLIWKPLEKELNDIQTIYYSPSGLLNQIAFAAIPAQKKAHGDQLLSDKYNLQLVSSTREITRLKKEKDVDLPNGTAIIYGGLVYNVEKERMIAEAQNRKQTKTENEEVADAISATRSTIRIRQSFLPGTEKEAELIQKYLDTHKIPNRLYMYAEGNEESFKQLSGTKTGIIHLATHGFFLEDIDTKETDYILRRVRSSGNPLLRSGLLLAGSNRAWTGQDMIDGIEDGILTADEISQMNLVNTKLVILSACQTGLGETKTAEGVFGLQRAFKLAGVETIVMSLWKVSDQTTTELMTTFYQLWLSGMSKQKAFTAAQKQIREKYKDAFYWAGFVMMD
ncbi:MAG: tetratricopeptide repeat protein [Marinilabiliaceae bacterium]|nr:tetratricopeptide repeat protein [Marinilabiliaceae bacterium]